MFASPQNSVLSVIGPANGILQTTVKGPQSFYCLQKLMISLHLSFCVMLQLTRFSKRSGCALCHNLRYLFGRAKPRHEVEHIQAERMEMWNNSQPQIRVHGCKYADFRAHRRQEKCAHT